MTHVRRRLALPAIVLAVAGTAAACGGSGRSSSSPHSTHGSAMTTASPHASMSGMDGMNGMSGMTATVDTGTFASSGGYALTLATPTAGPNSPTTLAFRILGPDGTPVIDYVVDQTKKLHLYLIRTDLTGFQHLHPTLASDGVWSISTQFATPGAYRLVADFTVKRDGQDVTHILGAPLKVTGAWTPQAIPPPASTVTVDGFTVTAVGTLKAGRRAPLAIRIARGSEPVTDLQPYLGVWAHLSAFRAGTLAFAHLHPTEQPMSGMAMGNPEPLRFNAELPTPGTYRVYVQFQIGGVLHTAALALPAS